MWKKVGIEAELERERAGRQNALADEFDRLADYLALMALRMGPRLQALLDLPVATIGSRFGGIPSELPGLAWPGLPSGGVTVVPGSISHGQGHETMYKIILSDRLGIPEEQIRVSRNDTDLAADGGGTFKGRLQFVDSLVDASSGAVKAKAVFDNKDNKLWPGLFVNVGLTTKNIEDALVEWFGPQWPHIPAISDNPLKWLMRAYVATQYGDEVEDASPFEFSVTQGPETSALQTGAQQAASKSGMSSWFKQKSW